MRQAVAANLRIARTHAGLSQRALAREMGVSKSTLSQWENAHRFPAPEKIEALVTRLDILPCRFFCVGRDACLNPCRESKGKPLS